MGRAIDLFVTYRFVKLLVTPFNKTEAYKLGIIDEKGLRKRVEGTNKATPLNTSKEKNAYTVLHKLVFNIKRIFNKVPGLGSKLGTYAAALFLLKDTFKEEVNPDMFEREFLKYIKENDIKLDNSITEEVQLDGDLLPKGMYKLSNDIIVDEEDEDIPVVEAGDEVDVFDDTAPVDTILGVPVFPVIHNDTKQKIYVSLDDIEQISPDDALGEF
mgnify:FL=1|tara:strand:+ start:173 stop:814 length:642 start_codon:yes stop_codon:yes gene_type:complete